MPKSNQTIYITSLDLDIPKVKITKNYTKFIKVKKYTNLRVFLLLNKLEEEYNLNLNFSQLEYSKLTLVVYFSQIKMINCKISIKNLGLNTQTNIHSLIQCDDGEICDFEVKIEHLKNQQFSSQNFYFCLKNDAKINFKNSVITHKNSFDTNVEQQIRSLILSKKSYLNTQPFLEIYNPTCVASHGISNKFLDPKTTFYMQSRGLNILQINNLLQDNFGKEVLSLFKPICLRKSNM